MPANIDTMMHVGAMPWHGLSKDMTLDPPHNAYEIVAAAEIGWKVNHEPMFTERHEYVPNYECIYREDNNNILGVVNKKTPIIVQNTDMFNSVDAFIGSDLQVETAASLGLGETVFGCFKITQSYKLLDDDMVHYFVIVNDHLRPDGKVTVLNTPVRVVCQNTLSEALGKNYAKMRIPISSEVSINRTVAETLFNNVHPALLDLSKTAETMYSKKIDDGYITRLLDIMFPFQLVDGNILPSRANDTVAMQRDMFMNACMDADNLGNYRGTQWQVFNALTDYTQHVYRSSEKAYDINYRMSLLPGVKQNVETSKVVKFLKIADQLAA